MFARRIAAGLLIVCVILSCMCGCKKSKKKGSKLEKSPEEQTEALLDDFCAFLKSGRYDRLEKLVDGESQEIGNLQTYSMSEVSGILDASLKELSFKIEKVEKDGDGTKAEMTVNYFSTADLVESVEDTDTPRDVEKKIGEVAKVTLSFDMHAVLTDQWQVAHEDVDFFLKSLFGYIRLLNFGTEATSPTDPKSAFIPFSVYETYWYDAKYNNVPGLHETEKEIRNYLVTWDYYNKVEVRYEFVDANGDIVDSGTMELLGNTDIIDIALNPTRKLPIGMLTCKVYDPDGKCFSEASIEVFKDGTRIPVDFDFVGPIMLDELGNVVTEYPFGTEYIAGRINSSVSYKDIQLDYKVFTQDDYKSKGKPVSEGTLLPPEGQEASEYIMPVKPEDANTLLEGEYYFVLYDMRGNEYKKTKFTIVPSELSTETSETDGSGTLDPNAKYDLTGMVICIDPGHQSKANNDTEALAPWSDEQKAKVSAGTSGISTGRAEHEVNLEIGLKLKALLESMGAKVVMTRETADVDISNIERAKIAVNCKADVFLRLHCDSSDDPEKRGVGVFVCSKGELADKQVHWGDMLGECYAEATGAKYNGCNASTTYSGLNWATSVPSFLLEMGYMSNAKDDKLLSDPDYQDKICDGIAAFCFAMKNEGE